ncbi:PQQ-binding-like beta-propeller repeat protein, partial [Streptomyces sp. ISL-66]|uniref:PQQ-binding-like beta-propeller repeat protein n=1 Tax=Streptomyces sp. ISL-66 TaxID=2819186 RepID=UPI001BE6D7D0
AKDPAERPSADALIAELRAVAYPTDEDTQAFIPRPRRPVPEEQATHRRDRIAAPARGPRERGPAPVAAASAGRGRRRARLVLAAGLGLLLAGGSVGGYLWASSDGPSRSGDAPSRRLAAPRAPAGQQPPPWSVRLGERGAACSWQAPALYCSGPEASAVRLDPADGSTLWSVPATAPDSRPASDSAPLHGDGVVLAVAPGSELLRALDPATGTERWQRTLPGGGHALPAGGHVLIAAADGTVVALDPATGAQRWSKRIGGVGSVWWSGTQEAGGPSAPYVATPDKDGRATQLAAVDPASGSPRWQLRSPGLLHPVGAAGGGLYLLDTDARGRTGAVVRVDLATRAVRRVQLGSPLYETQATVGPDGTVYVFGATGALVAVDATREVWRLETGVALASRPVFADGRVYLSASDGRLLAVDAGAGRLLGQTKPRIGAGKDTFAATLPAPAVGGGRVYASAPDGTVFAVTAGDPAGW